MPVKSMEAYGIEEEDLYVKSTRDYTGNGDAIW